MIVLDTNVLSEPMKSAPDATVIRWLDAQDATELFTTSTVVAELAHGVSRLPDGKRRQQIAERIDRVVSGEFLGGILEFDLPSALEYGALVAAVERTGTRVPMADAQIAAVCRVHNATLGTRNVKHFAGLGIELVTPGISSAADYQAPGL